MAQSLNLFLLSFLLLHLAAAAHPRVYSFTSFNDTNKGNFHTSNSTAISSGALQITPDYNPQPGYSMVNQSGRVLLSQRFKLWEGSASKLHIASFNTSFDMSVSRVNGMSPPGEGLAFLIAPDTSGPPPGSDGGYLGLTNSTLDGNPTNHLIAIEFDTVKEAFAADLNDNHVGLDINSVNSTATANLTGIEIANASSIVWTVWIDYNGSSRRIAVYIDATGNPKPAAPVLNTSLDISLHLNKISYFGFAASTGSNYELNCIKQWYLTVDNLDDGFPLWKYAVVVGIPSVVVAIVAGLVVNAYMARRRERDQSMKDTLKSLPGMPREFTFRELKKATNNFDERMKLGQGGFGVVYKGLIPGEATEVAVKKFLREGMSSQVDFLQELTIINRLRHRHLVRLVGWCHKNGMLLLVYEYMPNGSLDQHLFGGPDRPLLTWSRRYNIIGGLASALHYLHNEYDQTVVHRDLKASNIMLDSGFGARLGDFGLARAVDTDKTSYIQIKLGGVLGTMGYIAPECFLTGKATRQSDVFGFGAVVLEVACGRGPRGEIEGFQLLSDWVWKLYREGRILEAVDPRLAGDYVVEEAKRLLLLGLSCSHPIPNERPTMQPIVQILSGSVEPPVVPPFKPSFVWPSAGADGDDVESGGTTRLTVSSEVPSSY